jgi:hypothetical protein
VGVLMADTVVSGDFDAVLSFVDDLLRHNDYGVDSRREEHLDGPTPAEATFAVTLTYAKKLKSSMMERARRGFDAYHGGPIRGGSDVSQLTVRVTRRDGFVGVEAVDAGDGMADSLVRLVVEEFSA